MKLIRWIASLFNKPKNRKCETKSQALDRITDEMIYIHKKKYGRPSEHKVKEFRRMAKQLYNEARDGLKAK